MQHRQAPTASPSRSNCLQSDAYLRSGVQPDRTFPWGNPMKKLIIAACAGLLACAVLGPVGLASAHEVQPMIATVSPSGSNANYRVMIRNTDAMPITLEIAAYRVEVDAEGTAVRTPEDNDVVLFPPQTIVQPGGTQAVQVRYVGDPAITQGRVYAIVISQLPVDFAMASGTDGSQTQVKIGFDFVSHMFVQPPTARPNLEIGAATRNAQGDIVFDVTNSGDGVALLRTAEWTLTPSSGTPVVLDSEKVDFGKFGAILPGGTRKMVISSQAVSDTSANVAVAIALK